MGKVLVIKNADFSDYAIEKILIGVDMPTITFALDGTTTISAPESTQIFYTTDNSTPTSSSSVYTEPFVVNGGTVVKAVAYYGTSASSVVSAKFNSGGSNILYKTDYTYGYPTSNSTKLTEMSMSGYAISDYIPVPPDGDIIYNIGSTVQSAGMWNDYYKFKIVEYKADKTVNISTVVKTNSSGSSSDVGKQSVWTIRENNDNLTYKNVPLQPDTFYVRIVINMSLSPNVVDSETGNVYFQYIPDSN